MLTNAAPKIGPGVVLIPPIRIMIRTLSETDQLNWLGDTTPRKQNSQPAKPIAAEASAKMRIFTGPGRTPAASAKDSAALSTRSTGQTSEPRTLHTTTVTTSSLSITHQTIGDPSDARLSRKSWKLGPSSPCIPLV